MCIVSCERKWRGPRCDDLFSSALEGFYHVYPACLQNAAAAWHVGLSAPSMDLGAHTLSSTEGKVAQNTPLWKGGETTLTALKHFLSLVFLKAW